MMRRWLPHPLLSTGLLAMWLLLNQSLAIGHILLGLVLALVGGRITTALELPRVSLRRPAAGGLLAWRVLLDIIRSNVAVSRIILGNRQQERRSGFVSIPLDLRDRYGLAILAIIITATPGTIWLNFDSAKGTLLIHVLDLIDEADWVHTIKGRYERLLIEIFE